MMANKFFSKALSVGLSLSLCASLVAPALAASFTDLQNVIDNQTSLMKKDGEGNDTEEVRIGYDNGTVTLHENVSRKADEESITIKDGQNITIDMNGKSISENANTNKDNSAAIEVKDGGTLTLENSGDKGGMVAGVGDAVIENAGTLNLESGTTVKSNHREEIYNTKGVLLGNGNPGTAVSTTGVVNVAEGATVTGGTTGGNGQDAGGNKKQFRGSGVKVTGSDGELNTAGAVSGYIGVDTTEQGTVKVTGGTVDGKYAGVSLESGTTAVVDDGVITATNGIIVFGHQDGNPYGDTKLTVNGGTINGTNAAVIGNGSIEAGRDYRGTEININGGKIAGGLVGIYHPQLGTLNIKGGDISGLTGVEVRAGTLNIEGGTITGNYFYDGKNYAFATGPQKSGATTFGVGVAVSQHTTEQKMEVNIKGGTLQGYYAFFEQDHQNDKQSNIDLSITGGKLISTGLGENAEKDPTAGRFTFEDEGYETSTAVQIMDDFTFFVTGGMSTDEIGESYLGHLTPDELSKFDYNKKDTDGKVNCVEVIPGSDELPFQVGYLTAKPESASMTLYVDGEGKLAPQFYLSGRFVTVKDISKVVSNWGNGGDVVKIDADGSLTALAAGTVNVTATLVNGETVTFRITVSNAPAEPEDPDTPDIPDDTEIEDPEVPLAGLFTRGDAIGYLWEQSGSPEADLSTFEDVPEDHVWAVAIGWAQDMGIARADEEGNFRPDDLVLRGVEDLEIDPEGELQEFLNWYAEYAGVKLDAGEFFIELEGALDDVIMGEEAQVIFDDFFARLATALSQAA